MTRDSRRRIPLFRQLAHHERVSSVPQPVDLAQSLDQLDGQRWPDLPRDATSLVKAVHELRRRPVGTLRPDELARLISQDVGASAAASARGTDPSGHGAGAGRRWLVRRLAVRRRAPEAAGAGAIAGPGSRAEDGR
ncbi:contact-dependent growth inhibition system immunity protein [Streptomyces olivaceus]|uniref:contact-dependent growth inhibition system immunity protein n=1 Tax=Streptomyces olivaceus TaxID=47716 RepID=UPI0036E8075B